jgi:hypothetical protein
VRRTPAQRLVDAGQVALPDDCPPCVDAHAWGLLVQHVRNGVPYAALARKTGVSGRAVSYRVERLLARLRTPDLLCLPPPLWRVLVAAGYTTRAAIATASDDDLLAVATVDAGALWRLRHGFYDAPRPRAEKVRAYRAGQLARQVRPAPLPQERGNLPPLGELVADDDWARLQCHVCGRFFAGLALHARNSHGVKPDEYRERYGLARGQSLYSPAYQAKMRTAALARDQGATGAGVLREIEHPGRPRGRETRLATRVEASVARRGRLLRRQGGGQRDDRSR